MYTNRKICVVKTLVTTKNFVAKVLVVTAETFVAKTLGVVTTLKCCCKIFHTRCYCSELQQQTIFSLAKVIFTSILNIC